MTEDKRFQNNGSMIFDNRIPLTTNETVDLLNNLHEVNQQLKKEILFFQKELRDCSWKSRELTLREVEDAIKKIKKYE